MRTRLPPSIPALLWKEWRESWWLLCLAAAGPVAAIGLVAMVGADEEAALFLPLVLALLCGGRLFAGETARGTAWFLAERPVDRHIVWRVKVALPLCALPLGVIGAGFAGVLVLLSQGASDQASDVLAGSALLLFLALGVFAVSTCCSIALDRPVTAMAASLVVCVLLALAHMRIGEWLARVGRVVAPELADGVWKWAESPGGSVCAFVLLLVLIAAEFCVALRVSRRLYEQSSAS